ncbi:MAG: DUF427 domain-containing protein [Actinomycetota bacterium]
MAKAVVDGTVIAESDSTVVVEGNHYFPPDSIADWSLLTETDRTTVCPWKGTASYYSIAAPSGTLDNVAWTYHDPKDAASEIKDHVAFYPQVTVEA